MMPNVRRNESGVSNLSGLSGGALCAAAAKAAVASLLLRITFDSVEFRRKDDSIVDIPVRLIPHPENTALREYAVICQGVNSPGIENTSELHVSVERAKRLSDIPDRAYIKPQFVNLYLDCQDGVEIIQIASEIGPMGHGAIDKAARNLIFHTVADVVRFADVMPLLIIRISAVSFGTGANASLCKILGNDGDIIPISQNDIMMEIANSLESQYDKGIRNIIVVPGNAGHKYIQDTIHISMAHCIRCRNYIGNTIDMAAAVGMENFLLVGNVAKIIRLAAGIMDTHSWAADGRREILSLHTVLAGGTISQARIIQDLSTTDQMLAKLTEWGIRDAVMTSVCSKINDYMKIRIGGKPMNFGVMPLHSEYGILGQTPDIAPVLASVSREQFALSIKKQ